MLKEKIRYAAAETKVSAMYGKMISQQEWKSLGDCKSLGEMLNVLRSQPSWGSWFQGLSLYSDSGEIRILAGKKVFEEYHKLYRFLAPKDKEFIKLYLSGAESSFIMSKLRALHAKTPSDLSLRAADFLKLRCSVDIAALDRAGDYKQLLQATKHSIFYGTLQTLPIVSETGLPKHRDAGIALENRYYSGIFSYVVKNCSKQDKKALTELLGKRADFLNITGILRLRRYFPASLEGGEKLLIPLGYKLNPRLIKAMLSAKNEDELMKIIASSPYAKQFSLITEGNLDSLYEDALWAVCRRLIRMPAPGLGTVIAYLILSEMESQRLQGLIETISYGENSP